MSGKHVRNILIIPVLIVECPKKNIEQFMGKTYIKIMLNTMAVMD
jgi:hypothetical protein